MYKNVKTWNPFVGCEFNCADCNARQQAKRQSCPDCKSFKPHWHPNRLEKKFKEGNTIFVCSMGDISFAGKCWDVEYIEQMIKIFQNNPETIFMLQSKNPKCFWYKFPDNVILGTTIETTYNVILISKAPLPELRAIHLGWVIHKRKYLTIEPILEFDQWKLINWINYIKPEFVYIGYDNHNHHLNEPSLAKTQELITELKKITEVRLKTIRKAWWE